MWHREEQVLLENPDLIVSHVSCFVDERVAAGDPVIVEHLSDVAEYRLLLFFAYLAARNPRTHFIAYRDRNLRVKAERPHGWPIQRPIYRFCGTIASADGSGR